MAVLSGHLSTLLLNRSGSVTLSHHPSRVNLSICSFAAKIVIFFSLPLVFS